jgi:hypothetical protein
MTLAETRGVGRVWRNGELKLDHAAYVVRYTRENHVERSKRQREDTVPPIHVEGRLTGPFPASLVGLNIAWNWKTVGGGAAPSTHQRAA